MIEIMNNLFIGDAQDYEYQVKNDEGWMVIHACKDPYHRHLLGYTTKGAPKDHPEYLIARRGNILFLNLVDANDPAYIPKEVIDAALKFIDEGFEKSMKVLVHCNQGESRSPSIGLLYLSLHTNLLSKDFQLAEQKYRQIYPLYNPSSGMRGFLYKYWAEYI